METTTPDYFDRKYGRFGPERVNWERENFLANQAARAAAEAAAEEDRKCAGGTCQDILRLCSKHSAQYQRQYGRASNE